MLRPIGFATEIRTLRLTQTELAHIDAFGFRRGDIRCSLEVTKHSKRVFMAKKGSVAQLYAPPSKVKEALAEYAAGTWVAISQDQQRIVGSGRTAGAAERQAASAGEKASIVLQVPAQGFNGKSAANGNGGHDGKSAMPLNLPSFYRGIYKRVASKLGCDPSYVSRVARGERVSDSVSRALQSELTHAVAMTSRNHSRLRRGQA